MEQHTLTLPQFARKVGVVFGGYVTMMGGLVYLANLEHTSILRAETLLARGGTVDDCRYVSTKSICERIALRINKQKACETLKSTTLSSENVRLLCD